MRVRVPPPAYGRVVESLLQFAEELERRDADLGGALDAVERLQHEVEELRVHALAVAGFLASFPATLDALERDERAALAARAVAKSTLRDETRTGRTMSRWSRLVMRSVTRNAGPSTGPLARRRLDQDGAARRAEAAGSRRGRRR